MFFFKKYKNLSAPAKAALWFVVCNVINKGISLLATPILTRIMSSEQYGTFSVFQSWVQIFTIFCTLNLFGAAYTRGRLDCKGHEAEFESALLSLATLLTLVLSVLFAFFPDFWSSFMGLSPFLASLVFVEIAMTSSTMFWSARQRFEYRYRALVVVTIATNIFSLGVGILAILMTDAKVEARVVVDVIAKGVPGLLFMVVIFLRGRCFYNKRYWKNGLLFSLPLLPHFLSHYVLNQSDRLMINQMVGSSEAAFYSVAYAIATALVMVATALNDSYCPYVFQELDKKRSEGVRENGHMLLFLVAALTIVVMAFAPEVLAVFAGSEYYDAVDILPPLSASVFFIFLYAMMSNLEYFFKKTKAIALASTAAAIFNIVFNILFIPIFGYKAAAWTTLASYILLAFIHWAFSSRICRKELGCRVYSDRVIALVSACVILLMVFLMLLYRHAIVRYAVIIAVFAILVVNLNSLKECIRRKG